MVEGEGRLVLCPRVAADQLSPRALAPPLAPPCCLHEGSNGATEVIKQTQQQLLVRLTALGLMSVFIISCSVWKGEGGEVSVEVIVLWVMAVQAAGPAMFSWCLSALVHS